MEARTFVDPVWHSVRDDLLPHEACVADGEDASRLPPPDEAARHVGHEVDRVVLDEGDAGRLATCSVSLREARLLSTIIKKGERSRSGLTRHVTHNHLIWNLTQGDHGGQKLGLTSRQLFHCLPNSAWDG